MTASGDIESIRFRMVTRITSSLAHEVGDVDDHDARVGHCSAHAVQRNRRQPDKAIPFFG